ncbi:MAG: hypothetical protein PWQ57_1839 [Desulfovibrionales bacterium]|jgi:hypothetical protein|nr:hypothetical protein [Desulfovibrionales bacterium]
MGLFSTRGRSPAEHMIRMLLLLLVFLGVVWAFWKNNERVITRLESKQTVWDETGQMSERDQAYAASFAEALRDRYGVTLKLQIRNGPVEAPKLDAKTLFIGVSPQNGQAVVVFPPLLRSGLGESFVRYITGPHFEEYFRKGEWEEGLRNMFDLTWGQLLRLEKENAPQEETGG